MEKNSSSPRLFETEWKSGELLEHSVYQKHEKSFSRAVILKHFLMFPYKAVTSGVF